MNKYGVTYDSEVDSEDDEDEVEEMKYEPANRLQCEYSDMERTFVVSLVMEDQVISRRTFDTESDALQFMTTMWSILRKEKEVAIQEFQK